MITLNTTQIAKIFNYEKELQTAEITDVVTDSRLANEHTLFVALKGDKFDGHDFIKDVIKKGTPLVISERKIEGVDDKNMIIVDDTLKALGKLGQYNRSQYKGTVIALTGSSGKTTTKEELKQMLSAFAPTYATTGNFNNFIGVPRSLLDIDMNAKYAIIEMGMSATGEIEYLTSLTKPDIAIVTNVYPMHIEFLGTLENIARAKAEIYSGLNSNGIAIYNEDTSHTEILAAEAKKYAKTIYTYGKQNHTKVNLKLEDEAEHCYSNAWCVLKVAEILGLDEEKAAHAIENFGALEGRGKKHQLEINQQQITLIDDSYSGQPDAMKLAIQALSKMPVRGHRIALLGKMAELGNYTKQAHTEVGCELKKAGIDTVIGVCEETKDMLKELPNTTTKYYFENIEGISQFLINNILKDGDAILIKGAHYSSQVYKVAAELKKYEKNTH